MHTLTHPPKQRPSAFKVQGQARLVGDTWCINIYLVSGLKECLFVRVFVSCQQGESTTAQSVFLSFNDALATELHHL